MFLIYTVGSAINLLDVAITISNLWSNCEIQKGASKIILGGQQVETLGVQKISIITFAYSKVYIYALYLVTLLNPQSFDIWGGILKLMKMIPSS